MKKLQTLCHILFLPLSAALFLTGCGEEGSLQSSLPTEGYYVDMAPVSNMTYSCGGKTAYTEIDGQFVCDSLPVTFHLGNIKIGEISEMPHSDAAVFSTDAMALPTLSVQHPQIIRLASLLYALDEDADISNGITINPDALDLINTLVAKGTSFETMSDATVQNIASQARDLNARENPEYQFQPLSSDEITIQLSTAMANVYNVNDVEKEAE